MSNTGAKATAVILGASGAVGKPLLSLLVSEASPYSTVYSFARRPHPSPPTVSSKIDFKEIIIDFEKLYTNDPIEISKLSSIPPANTIFITMGTTRAAAGSMSEFEKIDRGYVVSAAKALHHTDGDTTMVYCSSGSSSSSSYFPYLRSKGLTEEALASVYKKTIILRPGFLKNAQRPQTRILEKLFEPLMDLGAIFSDSLQAPVSKVATAMVKAAQLGPHQLKETGLATIPPKSFNIKDGHRSETVVVLNAAVLKLASTA